jgi:6-methylsalicylate decarboxylase
MSGSRIDVHHHYLPTFYREALVHAGLSKPDGITEAPAWSEASALEVMDRLGIQKAFLSISSPGVHFGDAAAARSLARRVNEEGARLKRAHPDRWGFFASTPLPDVPGALDEVRHAFDVLGADGVVLLTHFQGTYLGHASLAPFYEELDRRRAVLFLHPTAPHCACPSLAYPKPMMEFIFDTTRSVTDLILSGTLERHPHLRVIVPHAGAALPILADRIQLVLHPALTPPGVVHTQVPLRESLRRLHYDVAGAPVPELLGALLQVADPSHLHYGSDWPYTPVEACEALAAKLDATPLLEGNVREAVMRENSVRLLGDSAHGHV